MWIGKKRIAETNLLFFLLLTSGMFNQSVHVVLYLLGGAVSSIVYGSVFIQSFFS